MGSQARAVTVILALGLGNAQGDYVYVAVAVIREGMLGDDANGSNRCQRAVCTLHASLELVISDISNIADAPC
jgi:hypothetical protein